MPCLIQTVKIRIFYLAGQPYVQKLIKGMVDYRHRSAPSFYIRWVSSLHYFLKLFPAWRSRGLLSVKRVLYSNRVLEGSVEADKTNCLYSICISRKVRLYRIDTVNSIAVLGKWNQVDHTNDLLTSLFICHHFTQNLLGILKVAAFEVLVVVHVMQKGC
jgi:hypothetical protein